MEAVMFFKSIDVLKRIKILLLVLLVVSSVHLFFSVRGLLVDVWGDNKVEPILSMLPVLKKRLADLSPLEYEYLSKYKGRAWQDKIKENIFFEDQKVVVASPSKIPSHILKPKKVIEEKKRGLPFSLIAISLSNKKGDNMAILSNKLSSYTYIVREGRVIEGYEVRAIKESTVILSYQGEEFTLALSQRGNRG
jgi:type II secretory pathway component PulC